MWGRCILCTKFVDASLVFWEKMGVDIDVRSIAPAVCVCNGRIDESIARGRPTFSREKKPNICPCENAQFCYVIVYCICDEGRKIVCLLDDPSSSARQLCIDPSCGDQKDGVLPPGPPPLKKLCLWWDDGNKMLPM